MRRLLLKGMLGVAAALVPLAASAMHLADQPFAVSQIGALSTVAIENVAYKEKPVSVTLELYDKDGHMPTSKSWSDQLIPLHASSTYSLGPLFLTPAESPYRMAVKIETDKNHPKTIEKMSSVATFTVAH